MNQKQILPPWAIHSIVVVFFIIISLIYNYPVLSGKTLAQHDVVQSEASTQEIKAYKAKTGKYPLWTNSMFGGMPTYQIYLDYPMSLTNYVGRFLGYQLLPMPAGVVFVYLLGFYAAMILLGFSPGLSAIGAFAYAFASYNIISIEAGHISKCLALGFAPPFVAAVILTYRGKYFLGASLAAFAASVELYTNHIQITYYVVIALLLYVIFELIWSFMDKKLKNFGIASLVLGIAGILAIGSHASRLWTTYEFSSQTIRSPSELKNTKKEKSTGLDKDYAFQWSYGIEESLTLLIPNFYGGSSSGEVDKNSSTYNTLAKKNVPQEAIEGFTKQLPLYWGAQPFTAGPAYAGVLIVFFFVLGLVMSKDKIKWWLLTVTLLFLILSWGKNFSTVNDLFFDYFPLYNKFRAVTMILSVVQIFIIYMGLLGLQAMIQVVSGNNVSLTTKPTQKTATNPIKNIFPVALAQLNKQYLYTAGGFVGFLAFILVIVGSSYSFQTPVEYGPKNERQSKDLAFTAQLTSMTGSEAFAREIMRSVEDDRRSMFYSDIFRSIFFVVVAAIILWFYLQLKLATTYMLIGIGSLVFLDLWIVDKRFLNSLDFEKKSDYENRFEKSAADEQILKDKDPHFRVFDVTSNFSQDATASYYHKSLGGYHAAKFRRYQELVNEHLEKNNRSVLDMLNTKYIIIANPQNNQSMAQRNNQALGNAWFVKEFKIVANADEEIKALNSFEPAKTAIIDKRFESQVKNLSLTFDSTAFIKLTSYSPDILQYQSESNSPQLAVFSEIYYDNGLGWKAFIDGKEQPHFRADYVLRAMTVPSGKHKIEFRFEPRSFYTGEKIALVCSSLLYLSLIAAVYMEQKQK